MKLFAPRKLYPRRCRRVIGMRRAHPIGVDAAIGVSHLPENFFSPHFHFLLQRAVAAGILRCVTSA
jgi:hypothetical protein